MKAGALCNLDLSREFQHDPMGMGRERVAPGARTKPEWWHPYLQRYPFHFRWRTQSWKRGKKNQQKKKKRMETKVSKLRRSVLIAYERLHPKSYPIDVVVLFF